MAIELPLVSSLTLQIWLAVLKQRVIYEIVVSVYIHIFLGYTISGGHCPKITILDTIVEGPVTRLLSCSNRERAENDMKYTCTFVSAGLKMSQNTTINITVRIESKNALLAEER